MLGESEDEESVLVEMDDEVEEVAGFELLWLSRKRRLAAALLVFGFERFEESSVSLKYFARSCNVDNASSTACSWGGVGEERICNVSCRRSSSREKALVLTLSALIELLTVFLGESIFLMTFFVV